MLFKKINIMAIFKIIYTQFRNHEECIKRKDPIPNIPSILKFVSKLRPIGSRVILIFLIFYYFYVYVMFLH